MDFLTFLPYLLVGAGVTYLIRVLPLVLVRGKLENRFLRSFLYYLPFAVLAVMTVPAVFSATSSWISATVGFAVAVVTAYIGWGLLPVAASSCGGVLLTELILLWIG